MRDCQRVAEEEEEEESSPLLLQAAAGPNFVNLFITVPKRF
jgi:hypothetical protein